MKAIRTPTAILALFTQSLLASPMAAASGLVVTLHDEVVVDTTRYRLRDVAAIDAADAEAGRRLGELVVGRSPRPGQLGYVPRHQLSGLVARAASDLVEEVQWAGPPMVRVRAGGIAFPAERIEAVAGQRLEALLSSRFQVYGYQAVGPRRQMLLPNGKVELEAVPVTDAQINSRMAVWVDVRVDGHPYGTVPVWFEVSAEAPVLIVSSDVSRGDSLSPEMVVVQRRDVAALGGASLLTDPGELDGMRAVNPLVAGDLVLAAAVEPVPAVREGQWVNVHARSGRVSLTTKALALSDGLRSDRIIVRAAGGNATYPVVVVADGWVTVADGQGG